MNIFRRGYSNISPEIDSGRIVERSETSLGSPLKNSNIRRNGASIRRAIRIDHLRLFPEPSAGKD